MVSTQRCSSQLKKASLSIPQYWHLQENWWRLGHRVLRRPTQTNFYLHQNSHRHPAVSQSWLPWYTHSKLSVFRIPSTENCNFSPPISRTMDTAISISDESYNLQREPPRPTKYPPPLHSYLTPRQHMANSAECWLNTSKVSLNHQWKSTATLSVKDILGLRTSGVYSIGCEYGKHYIGQTGHPTQVRIKEHNRHTTTTNR